MNFYNVSWAWIQKHYYTRNINVLDWNNKTRVDNK